VAQRVGRGIALLFHDRGTRRGWVVSSTPRPHFNPGKDPVPIVQEGGWTPGPIWTGGKSRPHRDSIPNRPARSQSLYRLKLSKLSKRYVGILFCVVFLLRSSVQMHVNVKAVLYWVLTRIPHGPVVNFSSSIIGVSKVYISFKSPFFPCPVRYIIEEYKLSFYHLGL